MGDKMYIIGLTGGIASGKSVVSAFLKKRYELSLIDADQLAREAVAKETVGLKKIGQVFGQELIREDGTFDRKKMGIIIADDKEAKGKLEAIIHPEVESLYQKEIKKQRCFGTKLIIYDCPLLFEANLQDTVDEIFVVVADKTLRAKRIMKRDHVSEDLAYKKMKLQMTDKEKEIQADLIIENNGSIDDLQITLGHYCTQRDIFVKKEII